MSVTTAAGLNGQPTMRPLSFLIRIDVFVAVHIGMLAGVLALL
jgi:hypothetical protein